MSVVLWKWFFISRLSRDENVAEMTDVKRLKMENQNLLETKNALNIVKDDLLQELDQIANKYAKVKIELENAKKEKGKHQSITKMPFFLSVQSDLLLDTWSDLDESWRVYRVHPALLHGAIFDFRFWPWTGSGAFPYHVIYVLWEKYLGRGERSKVGTYLLRTRIVNCTHPQNFIRIGSCVQEIVRHKSSHRTLKKNGILVSKFRWPTKTYGFVTFWREGSTLIKPRL